MARDRPQRIGTLRVEQVRGRESFCFNYDERWLNRPDALSLDPQLQLFSGPQYPAADGPVPFGLFMDSAPDRWGRTLMQRREAIMAKQTGRPPRRLQELDYLLGVHDEQRLGGIRLRAADGGPYLSDESTLTAPPWTSLRELQAASWKVQQPGSTDDREVADAMRLLLAPGSSIGGARPKAGVVDPDGELWIAKFPGRSDDRDVAAWEWVVASIARDAGVNLSPFQLQRFGTDHHTFLTKRFDRHGGGVARQRHHFASAMTMLGYNDGQSGASYLDMATWMIQNQQEVQDDLEELWRRIVLSICVGNTDDHLRNHGFLLTRGGWRLSPAYDVNPNPDALGLSLNIDELSNALDLDLAVHCANVSR